MTASSFERAVAAMRGGRVAVDEDLCVNLRGRGVLCRRCEKACPAAALSLSTDDIDLSESACTGCGACVPACPVGVFRLPVFDPERFLEGLGGCDEINLHCSEGDDASGGVVIPCHLLFDFRLAAAAFAEGVTRFAFYGTARCESCPLGDARPHIDRLRRALRRWFGGRAPDVELAMAGGAAGDSRLIRHDQVSTDRRGFLRVAGLRAAAGAAWLLPVAEGDAEAGSSPLIGHTDTLRKRPAAWRLVLWRRLAQLPWVENRALPWHVRSFDESCTGCMVCAERCPTGALEGAVDDTSRTISFDPSLCTNCTLCQRICPQDSVRPRLARSVAEAHAPRAILLHMAHSHCPQCGTPRVAGPDPGALCGTCADEQEMDEEWLAMLAD